MQYTKEVEEMVCVAKGPNHGHEGGCQCSLCTQRRLLSDF